MRIVSESYNKRCISGEVKCYKRGRKLMNVIKTRYRILDYEYLIKRYKYRIKVQLTFEELLVNRIK